MPKKKSWREKVNEVEEKIHVITPEWEERLGKGQILIPCPKDIERIICQVQEGELVTNDIIREILAQEKKVLLTAAIPTGVYLKYVALAAEEEKETKEKIAPYWRVIKPDGSVNIKFPGGAEHQINLLEKEGHIIVPGKGKKAPKVLNYKHSLMQYLK